MKRFSNSRIFSPQNQIRVRIIRRIKKNIKKENETTLPRYKERECWCVFDSIIRRALQERERVKEMRENATLDEDEEEAATSPREDSKHRERNEKMKRRR